MAEQKAFSHIDEQGNAKMVDVGHKDVLLRTATAQGEIILQAETLKAIQGGNMPKGDVFSVARIAGIQAAKRTDELIPLCHSLPLDVVSVDFSLQRDRVVITAKSQCSARTGVEMEALTAVSVAALTIYDMCKAVDKTMRIENVRLVRKEKQPLLA